MSAAAPDGLPPRRRAIGTISPSVPPAGLLLLCLACSPPAPSPEQAAAAIRGAMEREVAQPFEVLAQSLGREDPDARQRLEALSHSLFRVDQVSVEDLAPMRETWHARAEFVIRCALALDDPALDRREALALAMAYRTVCAPRNGETPVRTDHREADLSRQSDHWVARLDPPASTKR